MATLVDDLLAVAWPDGIPGRLDRLIDRPLCLTLLNDFKLGLIFPFDPGDRPVRLALSDEGERESWRTGVVAQWPATPLAGFLTRAPANTRRMVDSDGSEQAVVYLDDLQDVNHDLSAPAGLELMCATLSLPAGDQGALTRHTEPPLRWLSGPLHRRTVDLVARGAEGLWALRWDHDEVIGVLWVTESRWRDNTAATRTVVRGLGDHRGYSAALDLLAVHEREGYPDAVELLKDDGIDVTLGVL